MKHLTVSRITGLTDQQCSAALTPFDLEVARRLGNEPRSVLLQRAKESSDPAEGPWSREGYETFSRALGNDPLITAAKFVARGGKFTDPNEEDEETEDDDDDDPIAASASTEELVCSDDGAKRRAVRRMSTGARLHYGTAQPFTRAAAVSRARRS